MNGEEVRFVKEAFESNYIAPLGPQVDAFEREFSEYTGIKHCLALSSGTAAMHLALRLIIERTVNSEQLAVSSEQQKLKTKHLDVPCADQRPLVLASTLTFIGSVTPATFEKCDLTFIDCDRESWNMDPDLLEKELGNCEKLGRLPVAVIPTDLYGQCCNLPRIMDICRRFRAPVICDSAEAMGARYFTQSGKGTREECLTQRRKDAKFNKEENYSVAELGGFARDISLHAGIGAAAAVFSFNGNKIITTSGGGMLASDDEELISKARFLSQQARDPFPHYEHTEIGYNYRMSNILAAIGRGQLQSLDERVARKREIFDTYVQSLGDLPGIEFMPEAPYGRCTRWLTVILIDPEEFGADREQVRLALEKENIESRPVWKPMHMQPVFRGGDEKARLRTHNSLLVTHYPSRVVGGEVSEFLFERGLCLPSGTAMTEGDLERVVEVVRKISRAKTLRVKGNFEF